MMQTHLLRLRSGCFNHRAPFLGVIGKHPAEVSGQQRCRQAL